MPVAVGRTMARLFPLAAAVFAGSVLAAPAGGPALDPEAGRWVRRTLARLTLDEKIGQLIVPAFDSTFLSADGEGFARLAAAVRDLHVGGFVVFGRRAVPVPAVLLNQGYSAALLGSPWDVASTLNRLQALSAVPLLASADFETGVAMRYEGATAFPRAMAFGAAGDDRLAFEAGRITAIEGRALGIHVNFAPVADVNSNPRNPVINTRSFGEDPTRVGALVDSYARGVAAGGMIATLKHFPGHGDTAVDSHLGLPVVEQSRDRLERVELLPFRQALADAGAVMIGHIEIPALDAGARSPATLSERAVTGLLRGEMGYDGLVVTDSMSMQAVASLMPPGEAAVRAIAAGNDLLLESPDDNAAFAAVKAAVERGAITRKRLDESVTRILTAKARLGLHRARTVDLDALPTVVGARGHAAVADEVSRRAITLARDDGERIPLAPSATASVLYLSVLDYPANWGIAGPGRTFVPELKKRWPLLTAVEVSDRSSPGELDLVRAMAARYDVIVAAVFVRASSGSGRMDLSDPVVRTLRAVARQATDRGVPLVTTFFGNPYAALAAPELPVVLFTYDLYDRAERSAVQAIAGEAAIGGRLPIALPGLFPLGHGLDRGQRANTAIQKF
jgi:beta-glucosidase-like glycosyl hydrolase